MRNHRCCFSYRIHICLQRLLTLSLCCVFDHRHGHVSANVNGHCLHGYVIVILTVIDDHANVNGYRLYGYLVVILTVTTCDDLANVNDHLNGNGNENLCGGCPFVHSCQCEIGQFADGVYVGCVGYENKHVNGESRVRNALTESWEW